MPPLPGYQSARHMVISSHGQLVTSEHITKPSLSVTFVFVYFIFGDSSSVFKVLLQCMNDVFY